MLVFDERGKPEYPGKNLTRDQAIGDWWKASALTLRQSYSTELWLVEMPIDDCNDVHAAYPALFQRFAKLLIKNIW